MAKEMWKKISFGDRYEVSNKGKVRNAETKKLMKIDSSNCVYLSDSGEKWHPSVDQLVADHF
jgi:hypothetical protein